LKPKYWLGAAVVLAMASCAHYVADPFPSAIGSNDLTLVIRGCDGPISSGIGICRPTAGTAVNASWQAILPNAPGIIYDGQLSVQANGITKTYGITGSVVDVPLVDFFGPTWQIGDNVIMNATATMKVMPPTGIQTILQVEGQVFVRTLDPKYQSMPIDSGYQSWEGVCIVQYSSSGRSAVSCK